MNTVKGGRFLTLNTLVRVNQIEATRDRNVGSDETDLHTLDDVERFREAVERGWPGARITWALSWHAIHSTLPNYRDIRKKIREYAECYGDDVTFAVGGFFPNAFGSREDVNRDLHDALASIAGFMGDGYRPKSNYSRLPVLGEPGLPG
jgi:hypothetical protein